jgi:hypothetical protein
VVRFILRTTHQSEAAPSKINVFNLLTTAQIIANTLRLDRPITPVEGPIDWELLLHHADGHSLTPLLYATWRNAGQLERLPPASRARLAQAYTANARRNDNIRRELLEIHQLLSQAGVPALLLKGWALLENFYPDPATRVLYDHDLLVPAHLAERGQQALQAAGFRPLPGKDQWIEKHLPALWRNDGYAWNGYLFDPLYPRPVELHLGLWEQGWRGLRLNQLADPWAGGVTQIIAGTPMLRLSNENMLIHLAMHFAGHLIEREARLNQLLDLARLSQQWSATLDWAQVISQTNRARVGRFVYASLYLARQIFGAPAPPPAIWQQLSAATPPAFRVWLSEHGPSDVLTADFRRRERGQDYQLTFLAAQSLLEKMGIIRFAALPPAEQLVAKYHLRHSWLGPFYYPRYLAERLLAYRQAWLG